MLLVIAFLAFAALGWMRAARRGGTTGDKVQYALAHAIPGTLLTLLLQVIALRIGLIG